MTGTVILYAFLILFVFLSSAHPSSTDLLLREHLYHLRFLFNLINFLFLFFFSLFTFFFSVWDPAHGSLVMNLTY